MRRDDVYYVSLSGDVLLNEQLKYDWRLSENFPFNGQGGPYIFFVAKEELNGLRVNVRVKIIGLPKECKADAASSFDILFNPGTPLILDEYRELNVKEERLRLDNLAAEIRAMGYDALFMVRYKATETRASVTARVNRIITHLVNRRGIPRNRLYFAFYETDVKGVMVYAVPTGKLSEDDPFSAIDKLDIPRKPPEKK